LVGEDLGVFLGVWAGDDRGRFDGVLSEEELVSETALEPGSDLMARFLVDSMELEGFIVRKLLVVKVVCEWMTRGRELSVCPSPHMHIARALSSK
jgi:hypothetical protein